MGSAVGDRGAEMKPFRDTQSTSFVTPTGVKFVVRAMLQPGKTLTLADMDALIAALVQRRKELEEAGHGKTDAA